MHAVDCRRCSIDGDEDFGKMRGCECWVRFLAGVPPFSLASVDEVEDTPVDAVAQPTTIGVK